jgi:hypothetical protein
VDIGKGVADLTVTAGAATVTRLRFAIEPELERALSDDEQATNLVRN